MLLRRFAKVLVFAVFFLLEMWGAPQRLDCEPRRVVSVEYPALAQQARITGTVTARLRISPEGNVIEVAILEGHRLLAQAVEKTLREWRFSNSCVSSDSTGQFVVKWNFSFKGECSMHSVCHQMFLFDYPNAAHSISELPSINAHGR